MAWRSGNKVILYLKGSSVSPNPIEKPKLKEKLAFKSLFWWVEVVSCCHLFKCLHPFVKVIELVFPFSLVFSVFRKFEIILGLPMQVNNHFAEAFCCR